MDDVFKALSDLAVLESAARGDRAAGSGALHCLNAAQINEIAERWINQYHRERPLNRAL